MEVLPPMLFDGGEEGRGTRRMSGSATDVSMKHFKLSSANSPKNHEYLRVCALRGKADPT